MNMIDLKGRVRKLNVTKYRIDWDHKVSGPQKQVKDFLRPYWEHDLVLEEARIAGCLLRIDLWSITRSIMIEVSPKSSHGQYNPFFHRSVSGHLASMKRDLDKVRFAQLNGLTYVEIDEPEVQLNAAWFKAHHDITL